MSAHRTAELLFLGVYVLTGCLGFAQIEVPLTA
jgi:hypothetical protein